MVSYIVQGIIPKYPKSPNFRLVSDILLFFPDVSVSLMVNRRRQWVISRPLKLVKRRPVRRLAEVSRPWLSRLSVPPNHPKLYYFSIETYALGDHQPLDSSKYL